MLKREHTIRADERKVKQVLLNLVVQRAEVHAGEAAGSRCAPKVDGGTVAISVTDNGVGIAPEDQQAVFEEFRQVGADG